MHRRDLLPLITRRSYDDDLFNVLIGDDWELFLDWLKIDSDFQLRLRPLYRDADERWLKYATMALDFGVPSEEIVERSHSLGREIHGLDSDHYLARIPRYEALASHVDIRLRAAGQRGLDYMRSNYEDAIKRERKADFLG